jgi:ribosomal protein L37AE/L43A
MFYKMSGHVEQFVSKIHVKTDKTAFVLNPTFAVLCFQFAVKRKAVGIWGCKDCGKVKAGGAYTMK